jgi:hypothetical protein
MSKTEVIDIIIKSIGLPVFCYLKYLNYLVDIKNYGQRCEPDFKLIEGVKSLSEISISADGEGDGHSDGNGDLVDSVSIDKPDSEISLDLSVGNIDDIPEKDRNIFIDINTDIRFDSKTIENASRFDKNMNDLVTCEKYDKKDIDYDVIKGYLKNIYDAGIYYILNDLYYFKDFKIDSENCFVQNLFSNGDDNRNLLENIPLLTTPQFNSEYLSESSSKAVDIIQNKDTYLSTIDSGDYKDNDGEKIDKNTVDDILGFLYESERYSLYLYLIGDKQPDEGKKILIYTL